MLAGAAAAVPVLGLPAIATLPVVASPASDAEVLRRLAATGRFWGEYTSAWEASRRLFQVTYHHPDYPHPPGISEAGKAALAALAEGTGYRAAAERCGRLHDRYLAAARAAFDLPADGLPGVAAKLRFGAAVARDDMYGAYADNPFEWFDRALDDFERLSAATPLAKTIPTAGSGGGGDGRVAVLARRYRQAAADLSRWIAEVESRHGPCAYDERPDCGRRYAALVAREDRLAAALAEARPDSVRGLAIKLRAAFCCEDLRGAADGNPALLIPALHDLERLAE